MEYHEYVRSSQQATQLLEQGHLKEAIDAFYKLMFSDVSDIDKANMCLNLAFIYDKMGNTEEALTWYDKGITAEQAYCRYELAEKKAQYLSQLGRNSEAVAIYEELVKQPFVSEAEKERMRQTIKAFLSKSLREWK